MKTKTPRPFFRRIIAVTSLVLALGSSHAMAQRANGIDVSRWQGTIDWVSVKGSGVSFAWAQATRGAYLVNVNFVDNMNNGKAAGVLMGAYHFAFPATNSPSAEADYFWATAGPYIVADGKTLMPMLDIETFTGIVGATSYSDWCNQWYSNVVAKASAAGVTIKPMMYCSSCNYCNMNSSSSMFGCWAANYNGLDPQTANPWNVCANCDLWGGTYWNFWQYGSTGVVPGIVGNVDQDVFNGTVAQLTTWVATSSGPVGNNATAGARSTPASVTAGSVFSASITMTNTGTNTWTTSGLYRLGSQTPQDNATWGFNRVDVPASVPPNTAVTFTFNATAPATAGTYNFDWKMVQDGVQWFGAINTGTIVVNAVIPAPPASLTATAASSSQINLSWAASSGATSYNVKRATVSGGPYTTIATGVTVTSFSDTGRAASTTYYYVVSAVNSGGESANSTQASATTQALAIPPAPTGLTATVPNGGKGKINLSWTASSGATSYNVKRATVSGGPYTTIASSTTTTYNNTGLTSGTTYFYVVSAVNAAGESSNSNQASGTAR